MFIRSEAQVVFNVPVGIRVDTSNQEIKAVYELWKRYLDARPDSVYDNPCWSTKEKASYRNFDFSRKLLYHVMFQWKPQLLSIESFNDYYELRALYLSDDTLMDQNVWALQRIFAMKEDGIWKLCNALPVITKHYQRKTLGTIEYIAGPSHVFNDSLMKRTARFIDSVQHQFELGKIDKIEYYIADNPMQTYDMLGLSFYLGASTGYADWDNFQIFSGIGSEWYPHETAHLLFHEYTTAHPILVEGIATLIGGSGTDTFNDVVHRANKDLKELPDLTFHELINNEFQAGSRILYYATGAILCDFVYRKGGLAGLKEFLTTAHHEKDIHEAITKLFGVKEDAIDNFWRTSLSSYSIQHLE